MTVCQRSGWCPTCDKKGICWWHHALAAVGEGFCPEHKLPLTPEPKGGWCPKCYDGYGAWWSIQDGDTVVTTYPPLPYLPLDVNAGRSYGQHHERHQAYEARHQADTRNSQRGR